MSGIGESISDLWHYVVNDVAPDIQKKESKAALARSNEDTLKKQVADAAAKSATLLDPIQQPTLTSSDSRLAKRRSFASQLARKGRSSTILTQADDSLGAGG